MCGAPTTTTTMVVVVSSVVVSVDEANPGSEVNRQTRRR